MDGVSQHHRNIDELLGKSLDKLLINHVSLPIRAKLASTTTLSQIAQIITILEHFESVCMELEKLLTSLRSAQRGGIIRLTAGASFAKTTKSARERISSVLASKLNDLFELAHWLSTIVVSLVAQDAYEDEAYRTAGRYVVDCLLVRIDMTGAMHRLKAEEFCTSSSLRSLYPISHTWNCSNPPGDALQARDAQAADRDRPLGEHARQAAILHRMVHGAHLALHPPLARRHAPRQRARACEELHGAN